MSFIEQFKLQCIKLAEILRNALNEYHATSTGFEMELNEVSESNWLKSKRIWSLSKLFFRNKVFLLRETVSVLNIYCSMCRGCWQVGLNKEQEIWNFLRRSVKTPSWLWSSHLVFEMHLLVLVQHLNLLCWPLNLWFVNVYCFSHNLFVVVWMVFQCVVFFKSRNWNIFKK